MNTENTNSNSSKEEAIAQKALFTKILSTNQGDALAKKYMFLYAIQIYDNKDSTEICMHFIMDRELQNSINEIIFHIGEKEKEFQELSISDYIEIYANFALFAKFMVDKLKERELIKEFRINNKKNIGDLINMLEKLIAENDNEEDDEE